MRIVLAFSGGLDTSFCVPYLAETHDAEVHTVTVNTGGVTPDEADALAEQAYALGAASHTTVDARDRLFADHLSYLIKGNVLRGGVYPLCVGPERVVQARAVAEHARTLGAEAVAHGSTGAGNDQVRFDVAFRLLAPELEVLTPVRELGLSRAASTAYLEARGVPVPTKTTAYSINRGLWGTTVGGRETLTTHGPLPDDAYPDTVSPTEAPDAPEELVIAFEAGVPTALDGAPMAPVALVETLAQRAGRHGVGRDVHVGDTILGIKGRVGFEAPAPVVLLQAHRELEKIVLSKWQRYQKDQLADFYGMLLHEAQYFDPVMRDVEAFLDHSQQAVTGTVTVRLYKGHVQVLGCDSPYSMFDGDVATYGETNALWDGRDARGFAKMAAVPAVLAHQAQPEAEPEGAAEPPSRTTRLSLPTPA